MTTDVVAVVEALKATHTMHKRATLIYQCTRRKCALLYVFIIDGQRVAHQPRYRLSTGRNDEFSVAEARAKHTVDGDRRWKADTFPLSLAAGELSIECDHCSAKLKVDSINADVDAATRLPTAIGMAHGMVR